MSKRSGLLGFWLRVEAVAKDEGSAPKIGWIYSRYVKNGSQLRPSTIFASTFQQATAKTNAKLTIIVDRDGKRQPVVVYPYHINSQPFYTFTWSDDEDGFVYKDIPGTYLWHPDTNKIDHVTYRGDSEESAWVCFTDDLKYTLQDFGTGPGVRGLGVWNTRSGAEVFSGSYVSKLLNMKDHEIDIVYEYTEWTIKDGQIDSETEKHASEFMTKNPVPAERTDGLTNTLLVEYRLNLDTRVRKFLNCEYVLMP